QLPRRRRPDAARLQRRPVAPEHPRRDVDVPAPAAAALLPSRDREVRRPRLLPHRAVPLRRPGEPRLRHRPRCRALASRRARRCAAADGQHHRGPARAGRRFSALPAGPRPRHPSDAPLMGRPAAPPATRLLSALVPLVATLVAWWSLPDTYFFADDFVH